MKIYFKKSNKEINLINKILLNEELIISEMQAKKMKYYHGKEISINNYILINTANKKKQKKRILNILNNWQPPILPVSGADILSLKKVEKKNIGHILKMVEEWWVKEKFIPGKEDCLKKIKTQFLIP